MKKLIKILALTLVVLLAFVPSAFAADTTNETNLKGAVDTLDGVSRTIAEDTEGESFSQQKRLTPDDETAVAISSGSVPAAYSLNSLKFGHFRSITAYDGSNTFADWRFHVADETLVNKNSDAYVALGARGYEISSLSYHVLEFDMTTMTTFPSNIWIISEWRDSSSGGKVRTKYGYYDDSDGLWHFGDKTLSIGQNEWVHVTVAIQMQSTSTTDGDTTTVDYTSSVGRIFINGELFNEIYPYESAVCDTSYTIKQHYLGVGYTYGSGGIRTGMDENASVCLDNVVLTTCDNESYGGALSALFAEDFTSLTSYSGKEIVYSSDYELPSSAMALATVSSASTGELSPFGTLEEAIAYVTASGLSDACVTLYADQYNTVEVTAPLTLDLNGHTLYNGATTSSDVLLTQTNGDVWLFEDVSKYYATFLFYQSPYDAIGEPVATCRLSAGDSCPELDPELYIDAEGNRYEPTGNWILYDEDGNIIEDGISKVLEEHIGKSFILCPEYTSPDVYFTVIASDGTMTHYSDAASLVTANIPEGATVVLKKDTPYSSTLSAKNYKFDLNGYAIYLADYSKTTLFSGSGSVYVYSSRPGARIFMGTYYKNDSTDEDGNVIYSNQASFVVSDTSGTTAGTQYMLGYMDDGVETPYRIEAYCGAFGQLSKTASVSVYIKNFDIISAAGDNKGIFTTRYGAYAGRYWQIDECNILISNGKPLCSNVATSANVGTYVFNDSNIYGNGSMFGIEGAVTADPIVYLNSTNIYGSHNLNAGAGVYKETVTSTDENGDEVTTTVEHSYTKTAIVTGTPRMNSLPESGCVLPDGYMFIPESSVGTTELYEYPTGARYSMFAEGEVSYLGASYASSGYIGPKENYTKLIYQSVAIDSSVNVLFYLPKSTSLIGAYLNGENLLDTNDFRLVNGDKYYVVRVKVVPKDAYASQTLTLTFRATDQTVTLDASLLYYAQKLLAVEEVGSYATYYADSKALMKYVLYYIRTAALTLGGVDESELADIDSLLGDFELSSADTTLGEDVYFTTSVSGMLTAATLDLETKVGMVFWVSEGFVGKITVAMPNVNTKIRTYTSDEPAGAEEYIVLDNIPAYTLCEDVTVTLVPTDGEQTVFTFNLATYVDGTKSDIAYAVYAYAKQAQSYRVLYPKASVLGD